MESYDFFFKNKKGKKHPTKFLIKTETVESCLSERGFKWGKGRVLNIMQSHGAIVCYWFVIIL